MTDEQAVRGNLRRIAGYGRVHAEEASQAIALLDAKDAEIAEWRAVFNRSEEVAEKAVAHAEQAEAALAEERKAHQAFRVEVSEAVENAENVGDLFHFILPAKLDPLDEVLKQLSGDIPGSAIPEASVIRAAIERAGGVKAVFGEG